MVCCIQHTAEQAVLAYGSCFLVGCVVATYRRYMHSSVHANMWLEALRHAELAGRLSCPTVQVRSNKYVILTLASQGAYYATSEGDHGHVPAEPDIEPKDTTGAG